MIIGGFQKFSLIDYPGKTCAIIFTRGCNFRCRYCHNPELVIPEKYTSKIPLSYIYDFLKIRRGKLDAVSITGGEPTQHADLKEMLTTIKRMEFFVKLDSNGSHPAMLATLIDKKLVDYIAMDIKAPLEKYPKITRRKISVATLKKSIALILSAGIDYEFRTTIVPSLTSKNDIRNIARTIRGANTYYLQKFVPAKTSNPNLIEAISYSEKELKELALELRTYVKHCYIR